MITVKLGDIVTEDFRVSDNYHVGVAGLNIGAFDLRIYNDSGVEKSSIVFNNLQDLGNGDYRLTYTPDSEGTWSTYIFHTLYFPYGKSSFTIVKQYDITDVGDMLKRILGLTQENYYVYDTVYDGSNMISSKIRIYSDGASVGTTNNVIANYNVTTTYDGSGNMETYSVVRA